MGEIDQFWLNQIACSVARWFNDRHGEWKDIFTEAFVAIPIAEFLSKEKWRLFAEKSNQEIVGDKNIQYEAYDIFATKDDESPLLIELKFLRSAKREGAFVAGGAQNKHRISSDVARLRNARDPCRRILVVVVHSYVRDGAALMKGLVKTESSELSACDISGNVKVWAFCLKGLPSASM